MSGRLTLQEMQAELSALDRRYTLTNVISRGAYGVVLRAIDTGDGGAVVAIKRINADIFEPSSGLLSIRILREIKLLSHFSDANMIGLRNVVVQASAPFESLYMVMDIVDTDLRQVLRSPQPLTDEHVQFFLYQLLRALATIHSAGVIHRDITPANVLVNTSCDLKICDFGLAREHERQGDVMTDYVTMRWYRAPELVMEDKEYGVAVDMWSAGLIFAEMLGSNPLCQGRSSMLQLDAIVELTGLPTDGEISSIGSPAAQRYLRRMERQKPMDLRAKLPHATSSALDLLHKMLMFDPSKRISACNALQHPYLQLHAAVAPPLSQPAPFHFDDSALTSIFSIQRAILQEAARYRRTRMTQAFPRLVPEGQATATHRSPTALAPTERESRSAVASLHEPTPDEETYE